MKITYTFLHVFFVALMVTLGSCKNPPEDFPNDLDGHGGTLNEDYTDSLKIIGKTVLSDSVRGDMRNWVVLGSFHDPVLGTSTAGFYAAYRPSNYYPAGIPNLSSVDSVVVSLAYYPNQTGYGYVDKFKGQTEVYVHAIQEKLPATGTSINTDASFTISKPLGSLRFVPRPHDEVMVGDTSLPAQIRIKLNKSLGEELLGHVPALGGQSFFENYFYGLYFSAQHQNTPDKGCLLYFHPNSVYSKIQVYYTQNTSDKKVWEAFIRDGNQRINTFRHQYGNSLLAQSLGSEVAGETNLFLQPGRGTYVKLFIPGLGALNPDKNTIINKAQLIIPVDANLSGVFRKPQAIALVKKVPGGPLQFLEDYGASSSDGLYDAEKNRYVFNITRHVNKVASGSIANDTLVLSLQGAGTFMERVVLKGTESGNPLERVRLELFYSKIP